MGINATINVIIPKETEIDPDALCHAIQARLGTKYVHVKRCEPPRYWPNEAMWESEPWPENPFTDDISPRPTKPFSVIEIDINERYWGPSYPGRPWAWPRAKTVIEYLWASPITGGQIVCYCSDVDDCLLEFTREKLEHYQAEWVKLDTRELW